MYIYIYIYIYTLYCIIYIIIYIYIYILRMCNTMFEVHRNSNKKRKGSFSLPCSEGFNLEKNFY